MSERGVRDESLVVAAMEWTLKRMILIEDLGIELELGGSFGGSLQQGISIRMLSPLALVNIRVWDAGDGEISSNRSQGGERAGAEKRRVNNPDDVYRLLSEGLSLCSGKALSWGLTGPLAAV
jgi:hypothetical protein